MQPARINCCLIAPCEMIKRNDQAKRQPDKASILPGTRPGDKKAKLHPNELRLNVTLFCVKAFQEQSRAHRDCHLGTGSN